MPKKGLRHVVLGQCSFFFKKKEVDGRQRHEVLPLLTGASVMATGAVTDAIALRDIIHQFVYHKVWAVSPKISAVDKSDDA